MSIRSRLFTSPSSVQCYQFRQPVAVLSEWIKSSLWIHVNYLPYDKQMDEFRKAEAKGQAYVYTDFSLLSAGDLIQTEGHVMIATGNGC